MKIVYLHTITLLLVLVTSLLLTFSTANCQTIHRQTIGSQGGVFTSIYGHVFSQSIGQQSVIGTTKVQSLTFQQGFQQNLVSLFETKRHPININISIYPNPFTNFFTIAVTNPLEDSAYVSVVTMLGQQVYKTQLSPYQTLKTIPFDYYPSGTYIVQFRYVNQIISKKIIKN